MATTLVTAAPQQSSRSSLLALLIFIVMLIGAVFYVKPLWDEVSSLSLGRDDKLQQQEQLTTQLQNLKNIQQTLNQSSEVAQQTTLDAIPQRFEQDKLISDITGIAKAN